MLVLIEIEVCIILNRVFNRQHKVKDEKKANKSNIMASDSDMVIQTTHRNMRVIKLNVRNFRI